MRQRLRGGTLRVDGLARCGAVLVVAGEGVGGKGGTCARRALSAAVAEWWLVGGGGGGGQRWG